MKELPDKEWVRYGMIRIEMPWEEKKMRKYHEKTGILEKVVCNMCGNELKYKDGEVREGYFFADFSFGYFSRKDGLKHHFDLCEDCYDALTAKFLIPVEVSEETELV